MTDWVHALANEWGHWMRKAAALDGSIQGTLGRIRDEGPDAASIRVHGTRIPCLDFPSDVSRFHKAWLHLEPEYQAIIFVDYRMREAQSKKIQIMRKTKSAYYRLRKKALNSVAKRMALN